MSHSQGSSRGLQQIAAALDYIEERLPGALQIEDVALVARFSPYHFWRVFHAMTGETPGDYIRRRRLTCAARKLTGGDRRIIDIALDAGFDSQAAFTRAFKRQFHRPPAAYRRDGRDRLDLERAAWTPEAFAHVGTGGVTTEPRIETCGPLTIVGFEGETNFVAASGENRIIYDLWDRLLARRHEIPGRVQTDLFYELCHLSGTTADGAITPDSRFTKLVGQAIDLEHDLPPLPAGMVLRRVPPRQYAVFVHRGPAELIQTSCDFIYGVWARETDLRLAAADEIQRFDRRFFPGAGPEPGSFEIRVPVETGTDGTGRKSAQESSE